MTPYRKALIALTLATMVAYAVLIGLGSRYLFLGSEGLRPFDLRILGYTYADATTYIALLTPDQAALYVGPLRMLDTVFPILFGLWMGWLQWGITYVTLAGALLALAALGVRWLRTRPFPARAR